MYPLLRTCSQIWALCIPTTCWMLPPHRLLNLSILKSTLRFFLSVFLSHTLFHVCQRVGVWYPRTLFTQAWTFRIILDYVIDSLWLWDGDEHVGPYEGVLLGSLPVEPKRRKGREDGEEREVVLLCTLFFFFSKEESWSLKKEYDFEKCRRWMDKAGSLK